MKVEFTNMIVLNHTLDSHFGNVTGKTFRCRITPSWPSGRITRLRIRLKGHAEEPLALSKLTVGRAGTGAAVVDSLPLTLGGAPSFVVPAGATVDLDELAVNWLFPGAISVTGYGTGGTESDRLAAAGNPIHDTYLQIGDHVSQMSGSGFTGYPGYLSLVTQIDCDFEEAEQPAPQAFLRKAVFGCAPLQVGDRIFMTSGMMETSGNTPDARFEFPQDRWLDIDVVGKWGLTQPKQDGWHQLWAVRDGATGESFIIGDRQPIDGFWPRIQAVVPTADRVRYMPAVYRILGGHLEEQVVTMWPRPGEFWHQMAGAERTINVNWADWTTVGLQPRIPKEARLVWVEMTGSAKVRTPAPQAMGTLTPGLHAVFPSSTGVVEFKGTGSCIVRGWRIMDTY